MSSVDFIGDAKPKRRLYLYGKKAPNKKRRRLVRQKINRITKTVADFLGEDVPLGGTREMYQPRYAETARHVCIVFGNTDKDLAAFFQVSIGTIENWKRNYPRFAKACELGKREADTKVAARLFKRATGYEQPTEKLQYDKDSGEWKRANTFTHIPPDTNAAKFWLTNRQPDLWRERVEHTGPGGEKLDGAQQTLMLIQHVTQEQAGRAYTDLIELEDGSFGETKEKK